MLGLGSLCRCRGDRVKERLITQQKSLDKAKEASYKEAYIQSKRGPINSKRDLCRCRGGRRQ